jgi:hypothetical protein
MILIYLFIWFLFVFVLIFFIFVYFIGFTVCLFVCLCCFVCFFVFILFVPFFLVVIYDLLRQFLAERSFVIKEADKTFTAAQVSYSLSKRKEINTKRDRTKRKKINKHLNKMNLSNIQCIL